MGDTSRRGGWIDYYNGLGADSQYVEIVSRHFPATLKRITSRDFQYITDPINRGDFDTLTAAYGVMALKSYSQHINANPPSITITEIAKDGKETDITSSGKIVKRGEFTSKAVALRFTTASPIGGLGAFYQVIESGYHTSLPAKEVADGMEIRREFLDSNNNVTHTAVLGQPLTVKLSVRSLNDAAITNVAIDDLLPGGFEVVGSSLKPGAGSAGCEYVDMREDRNVFFTQVGPQSMTIQYQIKPCNRGQFVVPPVYAGSMYNRAIKACGMADHIAVVDPK